jgi:hypothetical protein
MKKTYTYLDEASLCAFMEGIQKIGGIINDIKPIDFKSGVVIWDDAKIKVEDKSDIRKMNPDKTFYSENPEIYAQEKRLEDIEGKISDMERDEDIRAGRTVL